MCFVERWEGNVGGPGCCCVKTSRNGGSPGLGFGLVERRKQGFGYCVCFGVKRARDLGVPELAVLKG